MIKIEFLNLEIGSYKLTDRINNYQYELTVFLTERKYYKITEFNNPTGNYIFLSENVVEDENGNKEKTLSAMAGIGGLFVHSDETHSLLSELKLLQRLDV